MSFTTSLLVVLTVVVVLLTFGFAAHQRTLAELVRIVNDRPPGSSWHGTRGRSGGLASGDRLPLPVPVHAGRSVVVFASPGCADCHEILGRLRDQLAAAPGGARLVSVWTGAAPGWAHADPSVLVVEEPGLVDDLGITRTPAVAVLDGDVVVESAATARADVAVKLVQRQLGIETTSQEAPGWS
jgi:hypothetical protein